MSDNAMALINSASVGDKVVILVPNGIGRNGVEYKPAAGKVVMRFPGSHLVLNMGGRYGKPAVANEHNIVRVKKVA